MAVTVQEIRIEGISTDQEQDASGSIRDIARIYYMIGEFGPYNVAIPKLEMTAQRVLMEIRQDAQKYVDILNLTF